MALDSGWEAGADSAGSLAGGSNDFFFPNSVCRMCSRGEAVFEVEELAEGAAAGMAVAAGAVGTVLAAPGLSEDSIFNTDEEAGAAGGSGSGGGGGGVPGGVVLTVTSPEPTWNLGGFLSDCGATGTLG